MHDLLDNALKSYQERNALAEKMKPIANQVRIEAKFAISLIRRDNRTSAQEALRKSEAHLKTLKDMVQKNQYLSRLGFYHEALEEYVEAKIYVALLTGTKLTFPGKIAIEPDTLIGGIADATGELVRRAITIADASTADEIARYQQIAEEIAQKLSNIRVEGKIRKKYDDVERNVRKLEEILYDIRLKKS